MNSIGHNSASGDQLLSFVSRIERLDEEKKSLSDDVRDVYIEAKLAGFDPKALRAIIKIRKQDADERAEHEAIVQTYMHALGMLSDTPLGQAAINKATQSKRRRGQLSDKAAEEIT